MKNTGATQMDNLDLFSNYDIPFIPTPAIPPLLFFGSLLWTQVQVQVSPGRGQPTQGGGSECPAQPPERLHVPDGE